MFVGGGAGIMLLHTAENRFVETELPYWDDTYAVIEDAWITGEHIDIMEGSDGKREYSVTYAYRITFMTDQGKVSYEDSRTNSGKTESASIPYNAYEIYKPNTELAICYNPEKPREYRFGSKAENTARAKSPVMPILAGVFCVIGICSIIFGPLLVIKIGANRLRD